MGQHRYTEFRILPLCLDEKSQIQALDREQPVLPMTPGVAERRTHTYLRNGTTSLFAALDVATGAVVGKCYRFSQDALVGVKCSLKRGCLSSHALTSGVL